MKLVALTHLLLLLVLGHCGYARIERVVPGDPYTVGYSARGMLIDGRPRILTAATIHYPRSTPAMWDSLMQKAKRGGINTIDTYVFWNMHEHTKGQYDFATDRANLPLFLETAKRHGLFVVLRIGPYVCAEWNYGGFPHWLRHEKDIVFRTWNEPFLREMKRFVQKTVEVTRGFLPEHGGPLIAMQIENEYGDKEWRMGEDGHRYARWCGEVAGSFNLTVPWIMCRQYSDVDHVIPTQNDFYCDQYLADFHRKHPDMPDMWTEMWPGWFQRWGEAAPHRPIEDIAYAVAKWYAYGGTYVAYYMYQGGTNFGRTSGPFIMTSYNYDGFIDEYGLENWPKYLHLADLHNHLIDAEHILTASSVPVPERLGKNANAHVYGDDDEYVAFLVNANAQESVSAVFRGQPYDLHRWSVTLVRKDKGSEPVVLYNTARLSKRVRRGQRHPAGFEPLPASLLRLDAMHVRSVALPNKMAYHSETPLEQIELTHDTSDYLWYRTEITIPKQCRKGKDAQIVLKDAGDLVYAYIGDSYVGMAHGRHDTLATFTIDIPAHVLSAAPDSAPLTLLSQTMGMAHNQYNMEAYTRGLLGAVSVCGIDVTRNGWAMQPTLEGVKEDPPVPDHVLWHPYSAQQAAGSRLRWYAIEIDTAALRAHEPSRYAIDLGSMTKGHVWVNSHHLGRYWTRRAPEKRDHRPCQVCDYGGWFWPDNVCRQKCGEISQQYYHLPPGYLDMDKSVLYVLEEVSGDPEKIAIVRRVSESPERHAPEVPEAAHGLAYYAAWLAALLAVSWALCRVYTLAVRRRGYQPIADQ
ncbi:Beta-galactosidase-1-like protein [Linderina pennispora]|nr:Beta-galactosidase-1-like protein [Linderina pennispora]